MPEKKADSLGERLLEILLRHRETAVSGQELSKVLGVTRAAVWKGIEALRQAGYTVESRTNCGYRLAGAPNIPSPQLIYAAGLDKPSNSIIYLQEVDSTNLQAAKLALDGAPDGTVVIAERQTAGAGRMGRSFSSPAGEGLYMSMILEPKPDAQGLELLTSLAGLAVCRAIESLCGVSPQLKWPNDVIIDGKKVCGILTRLSTDGETNTITHAVIGIGINVLQRQFEEELSHKAISLWQATGQEYSRAELAAEVISQLNGMLRDKEKLTCPLLDVLAELRRRSCTIGRQVTVVSATGSRCGEALDIDDSGALRVRFDSGIETVFSGEVSVQGVLGYLPEQQGSEAKE